MSLALQTRSQELVARWRHARRSFNARSLSERRLIIIAVAALVVFAVDAVWLTPSYRALHGALTRQNEARTNLATLREAASVTAREREAKGHQLHDEIAQLRAQVESGKTALDQAQGSLVPAREMREVLNELLAQHGSLRLVAMRSLPREELHAKAGNALMYSHGLEITVEGNYLDLLSWLRSLETMPRKLLWDGLRLESDPQAKLQLTLRVHTLSRDAEPLEIGS
jgi:MSHA biogenesis protein MshJ